MTCIFITPIV
ncbi:hypothetical protein CGLO_14352 [Colletotrichum gloeosporioides Cg-14]|uniref:Uncharacterized protein n=1 Tax=Colletotrichum gloeosporioides (strain Cg-14) TaxID=1237896 RepID=T0L4V6_COLGC|nr:hypothetical protein CGLO_14352 [Colletotrichum gloeosporioides Cg-14]